MRDEGGRFRSLDGGRATTSRTRPGARPASRIRGSRRPPTPTASARRSTGPPPALRQQPHLQRRRPERLLRARRHPVGLGRGASSSTTPSACAQETGGETAPHRRSTRTTRWRRSPTTSASIAFTRTPAAPGTGVDRPTPADQHRLRSYIDALAVYGGTDARLDWLRDGPVDGNPPTTAPAAAARRLPAARDAAATPADRARDGARRRGSLATPAKAMVAGDVRANENIALTATHTLFAREHNRIVDAAARALSPRSTSSRSPGGSSSPSSSTSPTTSSCRRWASRCRPTAATTRHVERRRSSNEFADRRLPRAQHDPRRVRADRRRPALHRGAARRLRGAGHRGRRDDGADVDARDPARTSRSSTPTCSQRRLGPVLAGARRRVASTTTTSRSTTSCAACCSRCRCPAPTRRLPGRPARCRRASTASSTWARSTSSAAATTASPPTTSSGGPTGCAPKTVVHRDHRRGDRPVPGRAATSTTRTASTSSALRDIDGSRDRRSTTAARSRARSPACAGPRWPPGCEAIYGNVDKRRRVHRHARRARTCRGTEFGELQLAIWKRQFEALRDGDRFFYGNDPGLARHRARLRHQRAPDARGRSSRDNTGDDDPRRTSSSSPGAPVRLEQGGGASATVPAALSLTLGQPASFGAFTPGVAKDYTAATTADRDLDRRRRGAAA